MSNLAKFGLPIGAVACIICLIAQLVFATGQTVSSTSGELKMLTARLDQMEKTSDMRRAENSSQREAMRLDVKTDHDAITTLSTRLEDLAHNVDVLMRDQNNMPIQLNVKDGRSK